MQFLSVTAILGALGAGALASLSPCVYPMIPITVGYFGSSGSRSVKRDVLLYFLGQSIMFTVLALIVVSLGETFGFASQSGTIQRVLGVALLIFGVFSWVGRLPSFMDRVNQKTQVGIAVPFFMGLSAALLASPCTTPVLSSVLLLLAGRTTWIEGIVLMLFYSVGFSTLFLAIALGLVQSRRLPRPGRWMKAVHRLSGALIIAFGTYLIFKSFGWV